MPAAIDIERSHPRRVRRHRRRSWHLGSVGHQAIVPELLWIVGGPLMFVLLFALFGPAWAILVAMLTAVVVWARSIDHGDSSHQVWHHGAIPDYSRRFRSLGRAVLLFAVFLAIGYSVPHEKYQEWAAMADNPKPSDCGLFSDCHYEPIFHHLNEPDQHLSVEWRRVED